MKRLTIIIISFVFASMSLMAQQANTLYYMDRVMQSQFVNVSENPAHKVQISGLIIPLFGQLPPQLYINYGNNSFNYNHIIHKGADLQQDSLVLDLPLFMKKLNKVTNIRTEMRLDYLDLAIRLKNNSVFSVSVADRFLVGMSLPYDLFEFAINGNRPYMLEGKSHDLSRLSFSASYFHEIGFGFNSPVGNKFMIGGKLKILLGVADFSTNIETLELATDPENYFITATANMQIRKSSNLIDFMTNDTTSVSSDLSGNSLKQALTAMGNIGVGLDLGMSYKVTDKISVSFSATDIGFINWMQESQVASAQGEYTFEGVELGVSKGEDGKINFGPDSLRYTMEHIVDTAVDLFDMSVENKSYMSWLPANIYIGATYQLHEKIGFGVLYRGEFYKKSYMQSVTLSANSNINHWLSLHASWSYMNNTAANVGFGLSARAGFVTWYFVTDDVIGMIFPQKAKTLNIRMGCNLTFGHPKKKLKTSSRL